MTVALADCFPDACKPCCSVRSLHLSAYIPPPSPAPPAPHFFLLPHYPSRQPTCIARMKSDHPAISPIPGPVQLSDLAGADVDRLDGQAIEPISRCVAARIVNEPLAVR